MVFSRTIDVSHLCMTNTCKRYSYAGKKWHYVMSFARSCQEMLMANISMSSRGIPAGICTSPIIMHTHPNDLRIFWYDHAASSADACARSLLFCWWCISDDDQFTQIITSRAHTLVVYSVYTVRQYDSSKNTHTVIRVWIIGDMLASPCSTLIHSARS